MEKITSFSEFKKFCLNHYSEEVKSGNAISYYVDYTSFMFYTKSGANRHHILMELPKKKNGMNFKKDIERNPVKVSVFHLTYKSENKEKPIQLFEIGFDTKGDAIAYEPKLFSTVEEAYEASEYNK